MCKILNPLKFLLILIVLGLVLPATAATQENALNYRDFDAVKSQLEDWARKSPQRLELTTIGSSAGGKDIVVARMASGGDASDQKPAVFLGANIAGFHNAGTEAALHLIETLLGDDEKVVELLGERTFYIAPVLNPDAHDGMFGAMKQRLTGNASKVDRDVDGFEQEDGPNDLNGDGRITWIRIPDHEGDRLPDPAEARALVKADPLEGQRGEYKLVVEGHDDDGDGRANEDGPGGMAPAKNFAHAFQFNDREAGPWPGYTPEAKAVMDFLLGRRNVAVAIVYGPANHLLAAPRGFGGGGDIGSLKFKVPGPMAEFMGFDPNEEYTIDEIWEIARDLPMVVQNGISKEQLAQFMGAGPATKPDDDDLKYIQKLADAYKKRLEEAGLDNKRSGEQSIRGGFAPWLYYQYGALSLELDIWGIPKVEKGEGGSDDGLTIERMAEMSSEEFLALDDDTVAAFLKSIGAPPQMTAAGLKQRVESGQTTPKQMAQMAERIGGGGGGGGPAKNDGGNDVLTFIDEHAPDAFVAWSPVTLPDGTTVEVGGVDPFIEIAPPYELLDPALKVHTDTILDIAGKLARVEIVETKVESLGSGIYRVKVVAANRGFLPTHTKMAERSRSHLPIRLELTSGVDMELVTGSRWVTSERLEGETGTLKGEWLVRAAEGKRVTVEVFSDNAGYDKETIAIETGNER